MPHDKAAAVLGSYLGVNNLEPAAVLDLDVDQITGTHAQHMLTYSQMQALPVGTGAVTESVCWEGGRVQRWMTTYMQCGWLCAWV
jgi:hypothetical protein